MHGGKVEKDKMQVRRESNENRETSRGKNAEGLGGGITAAKNIIRLGP